MTFSLKRDARDGIQGVERFGINFVDSEIGWGRGEQGVTKGVKGGMGGVQS